MSTQNANFDYRSIPEGHYDRVLHQGSRIRRLWHLSKFERVLDYLPKHEGQSLLDVGCFAGTFLSLADSRRFSRQVGVDILPEQIAYAQEHYGTAFRHFRCLESITQFRKFEERFDAITLIEVIEHLTAAEIRELFDHFARLLVPNGWLIITTPNYASTWPILERLLNRYSDVAYQEQHVTRFTYFDLHRKLSEIYPSLDHRFELVLRTTTHLLTPFLAAFSFNLAHRLSRLVPHARWRFPFGNLVLAAFRRRGVVWEC